MKKIKKIGLVFGALALTLSLASCSKEDVQDFFKDDNDTNEVVVPLDDYVDKTTADKVHSSLEADITDLENKYQNLDEEQGECFDRIIELENNNISLYFNHIEFDYKGITELPDGTETNSYIYCLDLYSTFIIDTMDDLYDYFIDCVNSLSNDNDYIHFNYVWAQDIYNVELYVVDDDNIVLNMYHHYVCEEGFEGQAYEFDINNLTNEEYAVLDETSSYSYKII